jgi:hypothetical protein
MWRNRGPPSELHRKARRERDDEGFLLPRGIAFRASAGAGMIRQ